jgi:hypothetical protein
VNAPHIFRFEGPVKWVPGPGPAGVTLLGRLAQGAEPGAAQLSLMCSEAPQLPAALADATVEALAAPEVVLQSGGQVWHLRCSTWQLHRDVGASFFATIPPRTTPWTRRLGWRVLLGIAGTAPGRWLLSRRSRTRP